MMSKNSRPNTNTAKLYLTLALLMGFWGYAFVGIKSLLKQLSPMDLTVLRFFFVLIAIGIFMLVEITKGKIPPRIHRSDIWKLVLLGIVGVVCYHLALNYGEQYTPASVASLIVFTSPIFTAIFASTFLDEKMNYFKAFGILVALVGSALIIISQENANSLHGTKAIIGSLIVFISPLSWALYTIFGRSIGGSLKGISRLYYSMYTMMFGSLILMLFLRPSTIDALLKLSLSNWINLIVLSIFSSFFGYIIWVQALEHLEATKVSAFLYLIPIYTMIFSIWILGERLNFLSIMGALAVFLGVFLIERY
ncbi:MAG: DMT family transporter [Actinobacteria bacterium]|nr:DMT family transporter [Actinomycetota bacterium]